MEIILSFFSLPEQRIKQTIIMEWIKMGKVNERWITANYSIKQTNWNMNKFKVIHKQYFGNIIFIIIIINNGKFFPGKVYGKVKCNKHIERTQNQSVKNLFRLLKKHLFLIHIHTLLSFLLLVCYSVIFIRIINKDGVDVSVKW